jgi:arginyl-tRNA synthetase
MLRKQIQQLLLKAAEAEHFDVGRDDILVTVPDRKEFGDYSTNLPFVIAKKKSMPPKKAAEDLIRVLEKLNKEKDFFSRVEQVGGFINFFFSEKTWQGVLKKILLKSEKIGEGNLGRNKKLEVEFISANPTGELHLGHGRGAFFGDVLSNVLAAAGYNVTREYYNNNAKQGAQIRTLGRTALGLGKDYLTPYLRKKINLVKPKLKKTKNEGEAGYILAEEVKKDIKSFITKKLKIKIDVWFNEEDLFKQGEVKNMLKMLEGRGLVYKKDGAEWIKTTYLGDKQDWVLIRKTGEPTYFLSDIAYHRDKFERKFNKVIDVWGADHQGHVHRMKAVAKIFNYKGQFIMLFTQIVRLKERGKGRKFSKRAGTAVNLEWLLDQVGLDAVRFFYLMKSIDTHMEFDLALAKKQTAANPVFYVQYAHTRLSSILKKAARQNFEANASNIRLIKEGPEIALIRKLASWPEVLEDVAQNFQVHRIPHYLIELADELHSFYEKVRVLPDKRTRSSSKKVSVGDRKLVEARLALIKGARNVMKSGLTILGVSAPDKM